MQVIHCTLILQIQGFKSQNNLRPTLQTRYNFRETDILGQIGAYSKFPSYCRASSSINYWEGGPNE